MVNTMFFNIFKFLVVGSQHHNLPFIFPGLINEFNTSIGKALRGEAVVCYREPLITQPMGVSGSLINLDYIRSINSGGGSVWGLIFSSTSSLNALIAYGDKDLSVYTNSMSASLLHNVVWPERIPLSRQ